MENSGWVGQARFGLVRVAVFGAGGRVGAAVCAAVVGATDLELVAAVDPKMAGLDLHQVAGVDGTGLQVARSAQILADVGAEVAVDFTNADGARENLSWCASHGVHAVCGTTGLAPDDVDRLRTEFEAGTANCVLAANFAVGAVLMMRLAEMAAPFMDSVEIIELHHDAKIDAPSGTALRTAERLNQSRSRSGAGPWSADPTTKVVLDEARGAASEGVRIHSVRLRGLVAHQEVLMGTTGQTLTIRHDSYDRTSYMPGVLLAIRAVPDHPGLTIGLDAVLGF
ncbi:MAG: 4-hydroxy-tetrahydrodipicolinate reductase [Acidimicrobiales bacterium]